jgi:hypothetical protein
VTAGPAGLPDEAVKRHAPSAPREGAFFLYDRSPGRLRGACSGVAGSDRLRHQRLGTMLTEPGC